MKYHVVGRPHEERYTVEAWQTPAEPPPGVLVPVGIPAGWWVLRDFQGDVTTASPDAFARYYEAVPNGG